MLASRSNWSADTDAQWQGPVTFTLTNDLPSGNHWAVESEIFWKARGDHLQITAAAIACVFKKFAEATARWYDAGERVERSGK
jgi:hypothetical protein